MLKSVKELRDYTVQATDGDVGGVYDVYFDGLRWDVRYLIVDTGPWLFGRRVLLAPVVFRSVSAEEEALCVTLTKEQVENSPGVELDEPVSQQQLSALHAYYGWPWVGGPLLQPAAPYAPTPIPPLMAEEAAALDAATEEKGDPHLRSCRAVSGYHIQARDGEIGHVEDFVVDVPAWQIRYLIVDTSAWIFGRRVLVSPAWVEKIDWATSQVWVDLKRETIEESPEYDPEALTRQYEAHLYRHYGRPCYWE